MRRRSFFGVMGVAALVLWNGGVTASGKGALQPNPRETRPHPAGVPSDPDPHPHHSFQADIEPDVSGPDGGAGESTGHGKVWTIVLTPPPPPGPGIQDVGFPELVYAYALHAAWERFARLSDRLESLQGAAFSQGPAPTTVDKASPGGKPRLRGATRTGRKTPRVR